MTRALCLLCLVASLGCGDRSSDGSDGGVSPQDVAALCSLPVGTDMQFHPGSATATQNTLSCTATINGRMLKCGPDAPTMEKASCSDGFGYVLAAGDAKLFIRMKYSSSWQAGAQFEGGSSLTGDLNITGMPMPGQTKPEAGAQQKLDIVFQSQSNGQNIVGNATLTATW